MSKFGWSFPPGAETDPNAPYNADDPPCEVCGRFECDAVDPCDCEECPVCGEIGRGDCYPTHVPYRRDSVAQFVEDRMISTNLWETMRAICRHGDQWVSLDLCMPWFTPGIEERYAHIVNCCTERERLEKIPPYLRIVEITTGTHACGYDAEFHATCPPGDPEAFERAQEDVSGQLKDWWAEFGDDEVL